MPITTEINNRIAVIKIDNQATLNALNTSVLEQLDTQINDVSNNTDIRCVIITGCGKAFVAGADISEMRNMSLSDAEQFALLGSQVLRKIETSNKVFIASINGYALGGGCELALACDIRIASEKAKFSLPEVSLGVFPGFSGIRRMLDIVGEAKTKELIFSGRMISAEEAFNINLVNNVVSPEKLNDEVMALADTIANNSFNAIIQAKKAINSLPYSVENVIKCHSALFAECFSHPDQKKGMTAFLEKRKPIF